MKILVFNGSPKKEKSDTMHITRAFLAGMNELAPQEVQTVEVADRSIAFCRGCFACKYNGGHCRISTTIWGRSWSRCWPAICCCSASPCIAMGCPPC